MRDDDHDAFRSQLASVHKDGRRRWIYARQPGGRFYNARTALSVLLLAFLVGAPFVTFRGQPLVLLNILERRFVVAGLVFWPQDFYLVVLAALTALVTLALSTAAIGRVWCGWLCPQTVFMEMVFRRIEYLIDGSAEQQVRRARSPMTVATAARWTVKHVIFFALSFLIANVFLAYIIGADALWTIVTDPPSQHAMGLLSITVFSLLFYGVFARFREQACTLACPYGRVMSALIDRNTITVTYDSRRGEPRGRLSSAKTAAGAPSTAPPLGDCVDCAQCVTVCPTGIDIRNGVQLECVNCTACMDACDDVMTRLHRPVGLIRLTSHEAVATGVSRWMTPRVKAYGSVWLGLVAVLVVLIAIRRPVEILILRQSGTASARLDNGMMANFYNVHVVNRSAEQRQLEYVAIEPAGASVSTLGTAAVAPPYSIVDSRLMLQVPVSALTGPTTPVRFEVRADGQLLETVSSSFLGSERP